VIDFNSAMAHQYRLLNFCHELERSLGRLPSVLSSQQPRLTLNDMLLMGLEYNDLPHIHRILSSQNISSPPNMSRCTYLVR
jgi:hypothetical protein